jgi:hypothetical protein
MIFDENSLEVFASSGEIDPETKQSIKKYIERSNRKKPFFHVDEMPDSSRLKLANVWVSSCFNCKEIAIWVHEKLTYPDEKTGTPPNPDIPEQIRNDIEEARSILNLSPRGAAALLRLSIQKMCVHFGEKGKNIDDDIKSLVQKGLSVKVQQALDIVRVIGNEAVHPGSIDLNDDKKTAEGLFNIVNLIADQLISQPKHVEEMYGKLPSAKLDAIAIRDSRN